MLVAGIAAPLPPALVPPAADPGPGACLALVGAVEAFDAAVFTLAALLVFPGVFFPYWGGLLGTLWSLALVALAYALVPVGRMAGRRLQARSGPAVRATLAALLLAACTLAIGLLPGYGAAGSLAIAWLVLCRVGQGLARGARAPLPWTAHRAPAGSGALLGLLLAGAVMATLASQLVHADFLAWGWRYPFCIAIAMHLVAQLARWRIGSPEPPATG